MHDLEHTIFEALKFLVEYRLKNFQEVLPVGLWLYLWVTWDVLALYSSWLKLAILALHDCFLLTGLIVFIVILFPIHCSRGVGDLRQIAHNMIASFRGQVLSHRWWLPHVKICAFKASSASASRLILITLRNKKPALLYFRLRALLGRSSLVIVLSSTDCSVAWAGDCGAICFVKYPEPLSLSAQGSLRSIRAFHGLVLLVSRIAVMLICLWKQRLLQPAEVILVMAAMMVVLIIFIRLIINSIFGEFVVLVIQVVFSDRSHHLVHHQSLPCIRLFGLWSRLALGWRTANHSVEYIGNACFERLYQACAWGVQRVIRLVIFSSLSSRFLFAHLYLDRLIILGHSQSILSSQMTGRFPHERPPWWMASSAHLSMLIETLLLKLVVRSPTTLLKRTQSWHWVAPAVISRTEQIVASWAAIGGVDFPQARRRTATYILLGPLVLLLRLSHETLLEHLLLILLMPLASTNMRKLSMLWMITGHLLAHIAYLVF